MFRTLLATVLSVAGLALAAPALGHAAVNIDRIYRGDDGSLVSFRQVGTKVYGFAENTQHKTATVLVGTLNGSRIEGQWYDVPKGHREERGAFRFDIVRRSLQRTGGDSFGPNRMTATEPGGFPWPTPPAAGYQGLSNADLDGLYTADDGARWWVRQIGSDTFVAVAEREAQLGVRPDYTTVYVGKKAGTFVTGTFADVAKGMSAKTGALSFVTGPFRVLGVLDGAQRTKKLRPQYSWDFDGFARTIDDRLGRGKVVGYSYAITLNGSVVRKGAGGYRTRGVDGYRPFTVDTQSSTASTVKTISAAIMLHVLHRRGISLNAKVEPYLPACWKRGPGIGELTFRHLLTHTSELEEAAGKIGVSCADDPWRCLARVIELGRTGPKGREYNNYNFALLRILAPFTLAPENSRAFVKAHSCTKNAEELNYGFSNTFQTYATNVFFKPAGIEDGFGKLPNHAYLYESDDPQVKGVPAAGAMEKVGAGYMAVSAPQFVRFLAALEAGTYGTWVRDTMKAELMGFDPGGSFKGNLGSYYAKNGGCPSGACAAQAVVFPNGVQAYVMVNSGTAKVGSSLLRVLLDGYTAALD
jgi:Beta-lactamase